MFYASLSKHLVMFTFIYLSQVQMMNPRASQHVQPRLLIKERHPWIGKLIYVWNISCHFMVLNTLSMTINEVF